MKFHPDHWNCDDPDSAETASVLCGAVLLPVLLIILFAFVLVSCTDPNAGRFPPGKDALILGLREGLEIGTHIP